MAYIDFTLREAIDRFGLTLTDVPDLFLGVPEVEPGALLRAVIPEFVPLALAINTEMARSELVIAPLLAALRAQLDHRFSIFSASTSPSTRPRGFPASATSSCPTRPTSSTSAARSRPSSRR